LKGLFSAESGCNPSQNPYFGKEKPSRKEDFSDIFPQKTVEKPCRRKGIPPHSGQNPPPKQQKSAFRKTVSKTSSAVTVCGSAQVLFSRKKHPKRFGGVG
jgi:hypothetical protein